MDVGRSRKRTPAPARRLSTAASGDGWRRAGFASPFRPADIFALLILLAVSVLVFALAVQPGFQGDEGRYARLAGNLVHGHFSDRGSVTLWSGPGYPLILVPFALAGGAWWTARALNILLLLGAALYLAAALRIYLPQARWTTPAAMLFGLYPPFLRYLSRLLTETFTLFLVCGLLYHFARAGQGRGKGRRHLLLASLFLGWLALTKIVFGYVIMTGGVICLLAWLASRSGALRRSLLVSLLALALCLPYLSYTYALTGRPFYWGTSGGISLYWMASPYPGESGSWYSGRDVRENPGLQGHRTFFQSIEGLSEVDADAAFRRQALAWVRAHPTAYLRHWLANVGRLLFNYPFTDTPQSLTTYFYVVPDMFLVVFLLLSIPPALVSWRQIPEELRVLVLFAVLSAGLSSIPSATNRQFQILVPVFALWICFIWARLLRIEVRSAPG